MIDLSHLSNDKLEKLSNFFFELAATIMDYIILKTENQWK